jgi:hypothetical protein
VQDRNIRQLLVMLLAAIDGLPERERLVTTLHYYEEVTMKDIGLIIGFCEIPGAGSYTPPLCCTFVACLALPTTLKNPLNKPAGHHSERARGGETRHRIAAHPS